MALSLSHSLNHPLHCSFIVSFLAFFPFPVATVVKKLSFFLCLCSRIFATLASQVLALAIYDTQCGAKIFRASKDLAFALSEPFDSRWIFDVELIARLNTQRNRDILAEASSNVDADTDSMSAPRLLPLSQTIYESPLDSWRDISGTKLSLKHKVRALWYV